MKRCKESSWNSARQLFSETGKLTRCQTEITGINTIDFKDLPWMSTSLLNSRAYQYSNAKAYVFSDSVLCVGKMGDDPIATWKSKIKWYSETNYFKEMSRIDGTSMEFEWKIFPGITTLGLLEKIQNLLRDLQCEPENFKGRIMFTRGGDDGPGCLQCLAGGRSPRLWCPLSLRGPMARTATRQIWRICSAQCEAAARRDL